MRQPLSRNITWFKLDIGAIRWAVLCTQHCLSLIIQSCSLVGGASALMSINLIRCSKLLIISDNGIVASRVTTGSTHSFCALTCRGSSLPSGVQTTRASRPRDTGGTPLNHVLGVLTLLGSKDDGLFQRARSFVRCALRILDRRLSETHTPPLLGCHVAFNLSPMYFIRQSTTHCNGMPHVLLALFWPVTDEWKFRPLVERRGTRPGRHTGPTRWGSLHHRPASAFRQMSILKDSIIGLVLRARRTRRVREQQHLWIVDCCQVQGRRLIHVSSRLQ